jgi:hypothetical protein
LTIFKTKNFENDGNRFSELERFRLLQKGLSIERINEILPKFQGKKF